MLLGAGLPRALDVFARTDREVLVPLLISWLRPRGFGFRGDGGPLVRWSNLASRAAAASLLEAAMALKVGHLGDGDRYCCLWLPAAFGVPCMLAPAHWFGRGRPS